MSKELRALLANASPLPWHRETECPGECCWHLFRAPDAIYDAGDPGKDGEDDGPGGMVNLPEMSDEDSALIVAAVNALPALLDRNELLEAQRKELRASRKRYKRERDELLERLAERDAEIEALRSEAK